MDDKYSSIEDIYRKFKMSTGVSTDTRTLEKGQMYFALKGPHFDGNVYAAEALEKGASYVVVDDMVITPPSPKRLLVANSQGALESLAAYHRRQLRAKVIGITGSNGKTTTKELLANVLATRYRVHATKGNYNNQIGVPLTILSANPDVEILVVEMGANHPGEIADLCEIAAPCIGYITNIGEAHLEGFGTLQEVFDTKTALFDYVCSKRDGKAFINAGDSLLYKQREKWKGCYEIVNSGWEQHPNDKLDIKELLLSPFVELMLSCKGKLYPCKTHLLGAYNAANIIAALEIGRSLGVKLAEGIHAISAYKPQNNRSEYRQLGRFHFILDAYNANLSSMMAAIDNFAQINVPHKLCVLGDMLELGETEATAHQQVVDRLIDAQIPAVLYGQRFARTEKHSFPVFQSLRELGDYLSRLPGEAYWILLKGSRGMRLEGVLEQFH